MGFLHLQTQNKCLLSKWLFRLANTEGVWQTILHIKYLRNKTLSQVDHVPGDSHFWTSLMKVKNVFLRLGTFQIGDGTQIRFWEGIWIGQDCLKNRFPSLFNIVRRNNATVASVMSTLPLNISFRHSITGVNLVFWY